MGKGSCLREIVEREMGDESMAADLEKRKR